MTRTSFCCANICKIYLVIFYSREKNKDYCFQQSITKQHEWQCSNEWPNLLGDTAPWWAVKVLQVSGEN